MVWIWWLWYCSSMGWISMPVLELGYFQLSFEVSVLNTCCWGYESHTWLEFIAPSDILLRFRMCAWCIGILCWIQFCDLCSYTTVCISQEMFRCVTDHIIKPLLLFCTMWIFDQWLPICLEILQLSHHMDSEIRRPWLALLKLSAACWSVSISLFLLPF